MEGFRSFVGWGHRQRKLTPSTEPALYHPGLGDPAGGLRVGGIGREGSKEITPIVRTEIDGGCSAHPYLSSCVSFSLSPPGRALPAEPLKDTPPSSELLGDK